MTGGNGEERKTVGSWLGIYGEKKTGIQREYKGGGRRTNLDAIMNALR